MEHGTVQMYRKELREQQKGGPEPCGPCREAQAEYMAGYRLIKPRKRDTDTKRATIRRRALVRLGRENPERLAALIAEEEEKAQ